MQRGVHRCIGDIVPADGGGEIIRATVLSNRAAAYAKIGAGKLSATLDDPAEFTAAPQKLECVSQPGEGVSDEKGV